MLNVGLSLTIIVFVVFIYSGVRKFIYPNPIISTLAVAGIQSYPKLLILSIASLEIIGAGLTLFSRTFAIGLWILTFLVVGFSLFLLVLKKRDPTAACNCFTNHNDDSVGYATFARNLLLLGVLLSLIYYREQSDLLTVEGVLRREGLDYLANAQTLVALVACAALLTSVLALSRFGSLVVQLENIRNTPQSITDTTDYHIAQLEKVAQVPSEATEYGDSRLVALLKAPGSKGLIFVSESCAPCETIGNFLEEHGVIARQPNLAVVSVGQLTPSSWLEKIGNDSKNHFRDPSLRIMNDFGVDSTPSLVTWTDQESAGVMVSGDVPVQRRLEQRFA